MAPGSTASDRIIAGFVLALGAPVFGNTDSLDFVFLDVENE